MIEIPLSKNGKNKGRFFAIIDDVDSDLADKNWTVAFKSRHSNTQYAHWTSYSGPKPKRFYLHSVIAERKLGPRQPGQMVDHVNQCGLDNRRDNLRYVSLRENVLNSRLSKLNTSGFKGVSWNRKTEKWKASLYINNKEVFLGYFKDKQMAIKARQEAEGNI